MNEKVLDTQSSVERARQWFDERVLKTENALGDRIALNEEKAHEELLLERKRLEDRTHKYEQFTQQEFLSYRSRIETQAQEFDEAISSIHRAILGLSKDKSLIGANIWRSDGL